MSWFKKGLKKAGETISSTVQDAGQTVVDTAQDAGQAAKDAADEAIGIPELRAASEQAQARFESLKAQYETEHQNTSIDLAALKDMFVYNATLLVQIDNQDALQKENTAPLQSYRIAPLKPGVRVEDYIGWLNENMPGRIAGGLIDGFLPKTIIPDGFNDSADILGWVGAYLSSSPIPNPIGDWLSEPEKYKQMAAEYNRVADQYSDALNTLSAQHNQIKEAIRLEEDAFKKIVTQLSTVVAYQNPGALTQPSCIPSEAGCLDYLNCAGCSFVTDIRLAAYQYNFVSKVAQEWEHWMAAASNSVFAQSRTFEEFVQHCVNDVRDPDDPAVTNEIQAVSIIKVVSQFIPSMQASASSYQWPV